MQCAVLSVWSVVISVEYIECSVHCAVLSVGSVVCSVECVALLIDISSTMGRASRASASTEGTR